VNVALPRVRDLQGLKPNSFDGRGNYALGLKEQLVFPEIDYDKIDRVRGMDIIINTTAKEFLFTYKLQVRTPGKQSEIREQVGSSRILAHSDGTYREFVGVEFTNPGRYTLQQAIVSCVSTGP